MAATVFVSTIPLFSFVQRRPSKVRIAQYTSCQASRHFIPAVTVNAQRRVATACLIINRVDLTGVVSCPFATALYTKGTLDALLRSIAPWTLARSTPPSALAGPHRLHGRTPRPDELLISMSGVSLYRTTEPLRATFFYAECAPLTVR